MTDFESLRVDTFAVDEELIDAASVGPELAHLAQVYLRSPRALVWHNPSPDWRLFVLLLPIASRLSLMANPIFAQLARAWGLHARFVGIDRDGLVHDFRFQCLVCCGCSANVQQQGGIRRAQNFDCGV